MGSFVPGHRSSRYRFATKHLAASPLKRQPSSYAFDLIKLQPVMFS